MACRPDTETAKVVVKRSDQVVVSCLCTCGNKRHGFSGTLYKDNLFPLFQDMEV